MILGHASGMPVVAAVAVAAADRHHHLVTCPFCEQVHMHGGHGERSPAGAVNGGRVTHCRDRDGYRIFDNWYVLAEVPGLTRTYLTHEDRDTFWHEVEFDQTAAQLLSPEVEAFIAAYEQVYAGPGQVRSAAAARAAWTRLCGDRPWPYSYFTDEPVVPGTQWAPLNARRAEIPVKCALYWHYDVDGVLLYIGISELPVTRGKSHARESDWVALADTCRAKWYPSREAALAAEKAAIIAERPLFNQLHNSLPDAEQRRADYLARHTYHANCCGPSSAKAQARRGLG